MSTESPLSQKIEELSAQVKIETIDVSYSEIISMAQSGELITNPDYQRLFRWSFEQQSKFIETVLLRLPVPPFFVFEDEGNRLELIDGLQRISSMMHFIDHSLLEKRYKDLNLVEQEDPKTSGYSGGELCLVGCDIITQLNGNTFNNLEPKYKLSIKRAPIRMNVIKRQSASNLRYDMFMRLNTGGSLLSPQEVRNCSARLVGEFGAEILKFVKKCANSQDFVDVVAKNLSQEERNSDYHLELVLRFFALIKIDELRFGTMKDDMDSYLEKILKSQIVFDFERNFSIFCSTFMNIKKLLGTDCMRRRGADWRIGRFSAALFDAMVVNFVSRTIGQVSIERLKEAIESQEFSENISSGAWTRKRLQNRIEIVGKALS
jgi:hypothetical protein